MFQMQSRSWNDIIKFYRELNDVYGWNIKPMVSLVEEITSSRYAHGIFPFTSHDTLCISQNSQVDIDPNLLLINFIGSRFIFKYRESVYAKNPWIKECNNENGFATFEHTMKTLKWFL